MRLTPLVPRSCALDLLSRYGRDILSHASMQGMKGFAHHAQTSVFAHSVAVAYVCVALALRLRLSVDMARAGARSALARLFPLRLARLRRRRTPPARPFPCRTGAEKTRGRSMRSPPSRKTPSTATCSRSRPSRRAAARAGWSAWRTRRARSARCFSPPTCVRWRPWPKRGLRRTAPPLSRGDRTRQSAPVPACPRKGR